MMDVRVVYYGTVLSQQYIRIMMRFKDWANGINKNILILDI